MDNLSMIWAESQNGIIGNHGQVPWHIPADMHHFVKITKGNTIVVGKNTYKSFPKKGLPHRLNCLISRSLFLNNNVPSNIVKFYDISSFLHWCKASKRPNILVCGGSTIYNELMPYCNTLYQTIINHNFEGDTEAPSINVNKFQVSKKQIFPADKDNLYNYTFQTWKRIKK